MAGTDKNIIDNENKALEILYNQISSFDSKASILISVLGIFFGLSISMLELIDFVCDLIGIISIIVLMLFWISLTLSILFSILVVMPRKRSKNNMVNKSLTYYSDLENMDLAEFTEISDKKKTIIVLFEQVKTNAQICTTKHKMFVISIKFLIPVAIFFFSFITLVVIF